MKIKDIAEAAGVSTATVSRVLSGKQNVRPAVRDKVMAVAQELNYTPNRAARSLRSRRSSSIGLIVADIQNPFFASLSRAVEDIAQANDYSVILCNTDENPEKEKMYLELMQNENAAGIILAPTGELARNFPQELADSGPMVVIDRKVNNISVDSVVIDNFDAGQTLTRHLLDHGYRRIAGLFGANSVTGQERRSGFEAALRAAGLDLDQELIIEIAAKEVEGHAAVSRLLEAENPPEAILTSSGLLATGAFRAIRDKEIAVPQKIAFATFDESPWTTMIRPAITVIEQPTYAIGQTAGEMLFKRIKDPERPTRQVVLSSKLIVRQSCGAHS
ncbi:transcriptional regulator, LacI family [Malonomonas rubra DSM 5091]|uniref:Transcriptional regulator, LacI family n=1 Tax=Malonomonas rubra DSM 5091 TaxID=1122189 RepID=A0A1M6IPQ5_MALRU|nr:substrate-binding domain-containing protein [Malonomonas rubra]SHJ36422.1 transcriptional regulator, LacI family [Malonomonas rubra DSM 5091]